MTQNQPSAGTPAAGPLDLLLIAPHPDDVELFCGGLAALAVSQGHRVGVLDLSLGELSTQGDTAARHQEAADASAVLGIACRENLGLPDGAIGYGGSPLMGLSEQLERLVGCLRALRPTVVAAPYWRERHPDHIGASELVTRAVFLAALSKFIVRIECQFRPSSFTLVGDSAPLLPAPLLPVPHLHRVQQVMYYPMRVEARVSLVVDISAVIEKKRAALRCFGSQIRRANTEHPTLISSPLLESALDARDASYGAKIGVPYGEGFVLRTPLPIVDPVSFLGQAGLAHALSFPEEL